MTYTCFATWRSQRNVVSPDLSIVIPTYNESGRIVPTIAAIASYLSGTGMVWELVVSDDGSTDDTVARVRALGLVNCRVLEADRNRGKGAAVRAGLRAASGRRVLFSDADLSAPVEELAGLLQAMDEGAELAIGSRRAPGAQEKARGRLRRLISACLRAVLGFVFPLGVRDSQCGFKLFEADAARRLVARQTIEGFSFDLELLWIASRLGMQVREVPVRWVEAPGSKVRPLRDGVRFLLDMVRIRFRHRGLSPSRGEGLRVALVSPHPPSQATLSEYGYHLLRELAAKPEVAEVVLLCDVGDHGVPGGLPSNVTVDACWRFDSLTTWWRLHRAVRRHDVPVVLFNVQFASFGRRRLAAALGLCAPALLRLTGRRSVVLLHNLVDVVDLGSAGITTNPLLARALTAAGRVVTRVVLLANRVAVTIPGYVDLLRDRYGAQNVYLAPHGSFGSGEATDLSLPQRPRLLAFGKFGTYKRVEVLVAAYRLLLERGHHDLELVVAGTDSPNCPGYLEQVRAASSDLPGLLFTGYVPEDEVAPLFRSATMVVFPYVATTGSSGPLHQAGEHGRAAVLPRIGDFLSVVEDEGYGGEAFEPEDCGSLADAVQRLLQDRGRLLSLAQRNAAAAADLPLKDVVDVHLAAMRTLPTKALTRT